MPRTGREIVADHYYHVINRGNGRNRVFHSDVDYEEFLEILFETKSSFQVDVFSYCLMPNHFHILLLPRKAEDLSAWLRVFMTKQVRLYHKRNESSGHLWQGRYKSFPVQKSDAFEVVMRYIERNALRAGLVKKAQNWKWNSLFKRMKGDAALLKRPPVKLGDDWVKWVNQSHTEAELDAIRNSVNRCAPFGSQKWVISKANEMGLESTIRPRGRPKIAKN